MTKHVLTPLSKRLIAHMTADLRTGCWNFQGASTGNGYGRISRGRTGEGQVLAHRAAWELHHMEAVPAGMVIMHTCDNRRCVNPWHLRLGTVAENNHDMAAKGRAHHPKGEDNPRAKVTAEQVMEIRAATASHKAIAAAYGLGLTTVRDIRNGRHWKEQIG